MKTRPIGGERQRDKAANVMPTPEPRPTPPPVAPVATATPAPAPAETPVATPIPIPTAPPGPTPMPTPSSPEYVGSPPLPPADAFGLRWDGTVKPILGGVDGNVDIVFNNNTGEVDLFVITNFEAGGEGGSWTAGPTFWWNLPTNDDLAPNGIHGFISPQVDINYGGGHAPIPIPYIGLVSMEVEFASDPLGDGPVSLYIGGGPPQPEIGANLNLGPSLILFHASVVP